MATTYISIDVAVRSLAVGVYQIKPFRSFHLLKDENPNTMNESLNTIIQPILMNVFDINNGSNTRDTTIIEKAQALKNILSEIDRSISEFTNEGNVQVLIEYQMNANHGANAIFNMIVMFYAGRYPIEIMKPALKNTLCLHPLLSHCEFLGRCSSNYKANKEHTKYNMLYLLTMIGQLSMIKDIKKCNHDDIADTLMQCLAYHLRK